MKKHQYKNRKLEELRTMTTLAEIVDFIVNVEPTIELEEEIEFNYLDKEIKEFQQSLELGYFNNCDLIEVLESIKHLLKI